MYAMKEESNNNEDDLKDINSISIKKGKQNKFT